MKISVINLNKYLAFIVVVLSFVILSMPVANAYNQPKESTFVVTAYYSPLPNQTTYHRANYEEELMLNGLGKVTASGSSIYKGVAAAPASLAFGTYIEIENVGFFRVEDRGSAIQNWGDEIRIDMWKGFGQQAMNESMSWGIRHAKGWIYPSSINDISPYSFNTTLSVGSSGQDVENLQYQLKLLGFFDYAVTGYFGDVTAEAVYQYQLFKNIVPNREFQGAGIFGPGTRTRFNFMNESIRLIRNNKKEANIESPPSDHYKEIIDDLYAKNLAKGDTDYNVYILQQKLNKIGLFNWPRYTYQYGDATRSAVLNFQLKYGVVKSPSEQGAGVFGPATREKMRQVLG